MLAPGHTSPGANLGLKITACMHSWGRFWTKDTKRPKNPTAIFEEPGAKAEGWEQSRVSHRPLHTAPPKRWANHLGNASDPTLTPSED